MYTFLLCLFLLWFLPYVVHNHTLCVPIYFLEEGDNIVYMWSVITAILPLSFKECKIFCHLHHSSFLFDIDSCKAFSMTVKNTGRKTGFTPDITGSVHCFTVSWVVNVGCVAGPRAHPCGPLPGSWRCPVTAPVRVWLEGRHCLAGHLVYMSKNFYELLFKNWCES